MHLHQTVCPAYASPLLVLANNQANGDFCERLKRLATSKEKGVSRSMRKRATSSTAPLPPVSHRDLARLLRELRATNRQLQDLQKLKRKIKDVGITLREVNKKIVLESQARPVRATIPALKIASCPRAFTQTKR